MSAIKEIWYGNTGSHENLRNSKEIMSKWCKVSDAYDELSNKLTEEQKIVFEKFKEALEDVTADETANVYEYAFSLGVAIGYEAKKKSGEESDAGNKD